MNKKAAFYYKRPLTDEELLAEAARIELELEELPLDNDEVTDEEDSEDEGLQEDEILQDTVDNDVMDLEGVEDCAEHEEEDTVRDENRVNNSETTGTNRKNEPNRKWRKIEVSTNVPDYILPEGIIGQPFLKCSTPSEYFEELLGTDLIRDIAFQSNLYATQRGKILNLKEKELLSFIGINFFMGYHSLPSYKHYWSTSADLSVPIIPKIMTRNRFQEILKYLHCNDNSKIPKDNKDKLYKIRPLVDALNCRFPNLYNGTREMAVDESMIIFKGRSSLKQYNPMKPIKRGYKLWCLADKKGYIKRFEIYQGRNQSVEDKFKDYGLGERVVLQLTEPEWGQSKKIFFDNYFTTISLLEKLKVENTLASGTIRNNRKGCPTNMANEKSWKRGEFDYRISNTSISYFKWKDTKIVTFASNFHGSNTTTVKRKAKDGSKIDVCCPTVVEEYNRHMGAVDRADQLRGSYCVDRKSKKWWHRLFFGLLDIAFINSFILYNEDQEDKITLLDFRRSVAQGLMNNHSTIFSQKKRSRNSRSDNIAKRRRYNFSVSSDVRLGNRGVHWPKFSANRERCENCSAMGLQSRPFSQCSACGVYLCCNTSKNCFSEYHNIDL